MSCYCVVYILIAAVARLDQLFYVIDEDSDSVSVCINITNNVTLETSLQLTIRTQEGSATSSDFIGLDRPLLLNGSTCFTISIIPDELVEINETFNVTIESNTERLVIPLENSQAVITITDVNGKFNIYTASILFR